MRGISRRPPPEWSEIVLARQLNRLLGTNLGPWDLAAIPDYYISVIIEGLTLESELAEAGLLGN